MWWLLLGFETICIVLVVWWLLKTYAAKDTAASILWMTGFAWACCFFIVVLVPSDISTYVHNHSKDGRDQAVFVIRDEDILINFWRIVYWVTFFGCWVVLPVTQSYYEAGEFTASGRLKAALVENIVFYGVAGVLGILFVAYIATVHHLTGNALLQFLMALANAWGLTLLVICLGYGLVEIPKKLMRQCNEENNLRYLQFKAVDTYATKKEAELDMKEAAKELWRANQALQDHSLQPQMDTIMSKCPSEYMEMAEEWADHEAAYPTRGRSGTVIEEPDISEKGLVSLHTKIRRCAVTVRRCQAQWDELCAEAWETEDVIQAKQGTQWTPIVPVGKSHMTGPAGAFLERARWLWKVKLRVPATYFAAGSATLLSLGIMWLELVIPIPSETARLSWLHYVVESTYGLQLQLLVSIPFVYMALCTYYSLFCLKLFNLYQLHPNQQTEGPNLLFNAALLSRLVAPLSFNYLQCIDENLQSSFQAYMGSMDTVPVLGESFNLYVPIFISLFMICTACNIYSLCARLCPGVEKFSFAVNVDQDHMNIEDGQKMLQRERTSRERHYQASLEAEHQHTRRRSQDESFGRKYDQVSTRHSDMDNDDDVSASSSYRNQVLMGNANQTAAGSEASGQDRNTPRTNRRKSLEAYYKERDLEALRAPKRLSPTLGPSDDALHTKSDMYPQAPEPKQEEVEDEPEESMLPNILNEPNPTKHSFGERPKHQFGGTTKHQFGGSSKYSFGGS